MVNSRKEGTFLLGSPTFADLSNNRLKCVETSHELQEKERDSYSQSKACRIALIDYYVANKKPPLQLFHQCPISKMKLICELTGDSINKSEKHIWKHMNGKRFLNKLGEREKAEKSEKNRKVLKKLPKNCVKTTKDDKTIMGDKDACLITKYREMDSDSDESDFWMPPIGDRWDFDKGEDRWGVSTSSEDDLDDNNLEDKIDQHRELEYTELSIRTKRMSIAVGPSSFASKKKKIKALLDSSD